MVKVPIRKGYPEVMSPSKADLYKKFRGFGNEQRAIRFSKRTGGQLYTQVDIPGKEKVAYLRGHHLVNRTGWYIVVKRNNRNLSKISKLD